MSLTFGSGVVDQDGNPEIEFNIQSIDPVCEDWLPDNNTIVTTKAPVVVTDSYPADTQTDDQAKKQMMYIIIGSVSFVVLLSVFVFFWSGRRRRRGKIATAAKEGGECDLTKIKDKKALGAFWQGVDSTLFILIST